jgi:putative SbcD/Mre11-related phosphoesterase
LKLLSPYAALIIKKESEKILVISDLHIGWEAALANDGIYLPSQIDRLLEKLHYIITSEKPNYLLVLGDIKHTVDKIRMEEWHDVPRFFDEICNIVPEVYVIPGNHDGDIGALLPEKVKVSSPRGFIIGDIGFFHGHTWPLIKLLGCNTLVIGHLHPVVVFKDPLGFRVSKPVWVKAKCKKNLLARFLLKRHKIKLKTDEDPQDQLRKKFNIDLKAENLVILPSFNDFLGGQAINKTTISRAKRFKEFIGPILRSGSVMLENGEVYLLDGTFLGLLDNLRKIN